MATVFSSTFIQSRIDAIQAQITATETAITSLCTGTIKSYTINTGQTTQSVTKKDLSRLQASLDVLVSQLQYWDTLLNGGGMIVRGIC